MATTTITLDSTETRTLKRALALLQEGRASAKARDAKEAARGKRRIATAFGYILGFLDGKGALAAPNPGYAMAFPGGAPLSADAALDQVEQQLQALLDPARVIPLAVIGLVALGGAIYAVGAYLLSS